MNLNHPPEIPDSLGDQAQVHRIVRQVIESYREIEKPEIPAPLKWAGGIVAALLTMGVGALGVWQVTTLSSLLVTVARMDERQSLQANAQDGRYVELDRRVTRLESYHQGQGQPR